MGEDCVFCNIDYDRVIMDFNYWFVIFDKYPVNEGHMLLIPHRHVENYFELSILEVEKIPYHLDYMREFLDGKYNPDGYNIGINIGEVAGQTINHVHIHLIPRYEGDIDNPEGGVRGVIPKERIYNR